MNELLAMSYLAEINSLSGEMMEKLRNESISTNQAMSYVDALDEAVRQLDDGYYTKYEEEM